MHFDPSHVSDVFNAAKNCYLGASKVPDIDMHLRYHLQQDNFDLLIKPIYKGGAKGLKAIFKF